MTATFKANVVNSSGDVVPNALIEIRDSGGAIIPSTKIFTDFDMTVAITSNPYNTDATGKIEFYIEPQRVNITAKDGATSIESWDNVILNSENRAVIFASLAAAQAADISVGSIITTAGYYATNDGGGGQYVVVAGGTGAVDGGSYIDMINGNQLELIITPEISVKQFGAVGDGVVDDTTAVLNCFSFANTNNLIVAVDTITLTSSSIPLLHETAKVGVGAISRGSDVFYVAEQDDQTMSLYISTSGNDLNDGLTPSQPKLTRQSAGDAIYNYAPANSTWEINIEAGTYNDTCFFSKRFPTANRVLFTGPEVVRGVQPLVTLDGQNGTGIAIFSQNCDLHIRYLECINWDGNSVSSGIAVTNNSDTFLQHVWVTANERGLLCQSNCILRVDHNCEIKNNDHGVITISNVTYTLGYNGTTSERMIVKDNNFGVEFYESSMGHVDFCDFDDNNVDIEINTLSRAHVVLSTFDHIDPNDIGVRARTNSHWLDNQNTFGTNFIKDLTTSYSTELFESQNSHTTMYPVVDPIQTTASGVAVETVLKSYTLPARTLELRGRMLQLSASGRIVRGSGSSTNIFTLKANGVILHAFTETSMTGSYNIDMKLISIFDSQVQSNYTFGTAATYQSDNAAPLIDLTQEVLFELTVTPDINDLISTNQFTICITR